MTAPISHGFPDYGRYVSSADKIYDIRAAITINGPTTFGPYFVGDVPAIGFRFSAEIQNFTVILIFYDSQTQTNELTRFPYSVRVSQDFSGTVPVRGPWLAFYVEPNVAGAQCSFRVMSSHALTQGDAQLPQSSNLISRAGAAVGAGATNTSVPATLLPGPAVWNVRSALATWTCVFETIDYLGAIRQLDYVDNTYPKNERALFLPPVSFQIRFTNTTAGAGTFDLSVVAHPLRPIG